jgi:hypothetical protein
MRLAILDSGHGFGMKVLFALIRVVSRQPALDVIKLVKYRADFYGRPMQAVTHEAMRASLHVVSRRPRVDGGVHREN